MSSLNPHLATHPSAQASRLRPGSGPRTRLRVLLSRTRLDTLLAQGADPAASAELALRARQLTDAAHRRALADSIEDAIGIADGSSRRLGTAPPLANHEVRAARASLLRLAGDLRDCDRSRAQGVALAQRLLTDGAGPLYVESHGHDALWHAARRASEAILA